MRIRSIATTALLAAFTALLAGCGESGDLTGTPAAGADGAGLVSLSFTAPTAAGTAASVASPSAGVPSPGLSVTRTDGQGNELRLDTLQLVLEEIELDREDDDECRDDSDGIADDDDCEEFEAGIRLFQVPLDGAVQKVLSIQVPAGTYDELEFEIDTPDDDESDDRQFVEDNPLFEEISVRAVGNYTPAGGQSSGFVFTADVDAEQEIALSPPLEVTGDGATNVTLRVDWPRWFTMDGTPDGTLFDPATANEDGPNEDRAEENIEESFEAFEDDDEDGEYDDDDQDDDDDGDDDQDDDDDEDDDDDDS